MLQTKEYIQSRLPGFPRVADMSGLRSIRPDRRYIWNSKVLTGADSPSSASRAIAAIVQAHPYVREINLAVLSADTPLEYFDSKRVHRVQVGRRFTGKTFDRLEEALPHKSGWAHQTFALGMVSAMKTMEGDIVQMPMLRFGQETDVEDIEKRTAEFGLGFVLDEGSGYRYYVGAALLPHDLWVRRMKYCHRIRGVDRDYLGAADIYGASVLPLYDLQRYTFAPRVVHVIPSVS